METVAITALDQGSATVDREAIEGLRSRVGTLVEPMHPAYDEMRSLWNGMIDRKPAVLVRCRGTADVVEAVRFARAHDLRIAVRGAGHNIAGSAMLDEGFVIDLAPMRAVLVEEERGRVRVQPGACWGDVDRETLPFGMAVPSGIVSTTGVSGLTLGGGFGWLSRRWGLTCDRLRSAQVVTASGEVVRASVDRYPDLFWGLRGGGGNFGVVTEFEFEAVPLGPTVLGGLVFHPLGRGAEVLAFHREFTASAPEELVTILVLRNAPPAPFLPESIHGKPVVAVGACWCGDAEEGREVLRPLKELGEPVADVVQPRPFRTLQTLLDAANPHGRRYYWKSEYLDQVPAELGEALLEHAGRFTSPHSAILVPHLGGAIRRPEPDGGAAGHRDAEYLVNVAASWEDAREDERHLAWVRSAWEELRTYAAGGGYVNFLTADELDEGSRERVRAAWDPDTWDRLARIKAHWDPENRFRLNANVQPAQTVEAV